MRTHVYLLSGVATSVDFMLPLGKALEERYHSTGVEAEYFALHPYGSWERSMWLQLQEARQDISTKAVHIRASVRGHQIAEHIMLKSSGCKLILIGHSAGGIAAIHAAAVLRRNGVNVSFIVQIGCPKHAVPAELRARTLYTYGVGGSGWKISDPVVRIGTWGGWEKGRSSGLPIWKPMLHAPYHIRKLPIIGGHADYFRTREPFLNEDRIPNIHLTTDVVWNFINDIN